jgi:hypothetical protein
MKTMKKTEETPVSTIKNEPEDRDEEEGFAANEEKARSFLTIGAQDIKEDDISGMDYDCEQEFDDDDEALFDEETEQVRKPR